jgi:hypothetical protein
MSVARLEFRNRIATNSAAAIFCEIACFLWWLIVRTTSENASENSDTVAGLRSEWARREQYRLDEVRYDIYVATGNGGFRGVWVCLDCGEHGSSKLQDSAGKASAKAQLALCDHHNTSHRPVVRKPR